VSEAIREPEKGILYFNNIICLMLIKKAFPNEREGFKVIQKFSLKLKDQFAK
jgi:hypothetical protein